MAEIGVWHKARIDMYYWENKDPTIKYCIGTNSPADFNLNNESARKRLKVLLMTPTKLFSKIFVEDCLDEDSGHVADRFAKNLPPCCVCCYDHLIDIETAILHEFDGVDPWTYFFPNYNGYDPIEKMVVYTSEDDLHYKINNDLGHIQPIVDRLNKGEDCLSEAKDAVTNFNCKYCLLMKADLHEHNNQYYLVYFRTIYYPFQ